MILFSGRLNPKDLPITLPNDLKQIVSEWRETKSLTIHTSGSTGEPKPIVLPKNVVQWSANQSKKALQLSEVERVLLCIPFTKVGGRMLLIRSILFGWDIQIQEATANPLLHVSENHTFTFISVVPYQLMTILNDTASKEKLRRFKTILVGGAALSNVLENEAQLFLQSSRTEMYHSYGMTETASHVALRNMRSMKQNRFRLLDGVKVKLSKSGCMRFEIADLNWVVKTKDVGTIENRVIEFLSRKDEVINSGGVKLHIHDIRLSIDKILEEEGLLIRFFLWKQSDDALGEKLVMVGLSGNQNDQAEQVIRTTLPTYDIPKNFYWTDTFERKESGKIDRQKTLERLIEIGG